MMMVKAGPKELPYQAACTMSTDVCDKSNESYATPKDWGADPLGKFLEVAHYNMVATFSNLRPQYNALAKIDRIFSDIIDCLNQSPELVAPFFLIRSHSSFRGAVRLCLSGQIPEAQMVLRGCLESALYGLYVAGDTNREEIWLRRHDDDASQRRVRNEFATRNLMDHLNSIDSKTQKIAQRLYDRTIDYGAHPNERAVFAQVKPELVESRIEFTADYFACGNLAHLSTLKSAAQIGICSHDIFYHVFRHRYQILGLDGRLDQIRKGF